WTREPQEALRQGSLRLRLCPSSAAIVETTDPQARDAEIGRLQDGSVESARSVPRGDLGRGARPRRRHAAQASRYTWPCGARRIRLGERIERGSVSLFEAPSHPIRVRKTTT